MPEGKRTQGMGECMGVSQTWNKMLLEMTHITSIKQFTGNNSLPFDNSLAQISHMTPSSHKGGGLLKSTMCPEGGEHHNEHHKQHSEPRHSSWIQRRPVTFECGTFHSYPNLQSCRAIIHCPAMPHSVVSSPKPQGYKKRLQDLSNHYVVRLKLTLCISKKLKKKKQH